MPRTIPIEEAERDLRGVLQALRPGETATLVDEAGASVGRLSAASESVSGAEESLQDAWDRLAEDVSASWQSEKSALEELQDQRNARTFEDLS